MYSGNQEKYIRGTAGVANNVRVALLDAQGSIGTSGPGSISTASGYKEYNRPYSIRESMQVTTTNFL